MAIEIDEKVVLESLKLVKFPGLSRDIVSFGFVKDLTVTEGRVAFTLSLSTENPAVPAQIKKDAEERLRQAGAASVAIDLDIKLPKTTSATAALSAEKTRGFRHIVAVASGKGGVGKSTVAANLAVALARLGYQVGLMDADIYGPSQPMMMGIKEQPLIDQENQKIIPPEAHGVKVMSLGFLMDIDTPVIWRGPMVVKAVEQLLADVGWGNLDYLIVDLPPGTGDAQLTLSQKVPLSGAVIVTTPQDVSLIDARKGLAMFRKLDVPVLGIIENMSFYECPSCHHREDIFRHGGGERTARELGVPFLGHVPLDARIVVGGDEGVPIVVRTPEAPASAAYFALAEQLVKAVPVPQTVS